MKIICQGCDTKRLCALVTVFNKNLLLCKECVIAAQIVQRRANEEAAEEKRIKSLQKVMKFVPPNEPPTGEHYRAVNND